MFKLILSLLLLPACLFGASIPFSAANPNQLGVNRSTGQLWITNNVQLTNQTTYGSAARTNAMYLGTTGLTVSNAVGSAVTTSGTLSLAGNIGVPSLTINTNGVLVSTNNWLLLNTNRASYPIFLNAYDIVGGNVIGIKSAFTNRDPQFSAVNDLGSTLAFTMRGSGASGAFVTTLADSAALQGNGTNGLAINSGSANANAVIRFVLGGFGFANERMRIDSVGFVSISNSLSVGTSIFVTNGVGSYATTTTVNIGATGWTNTFGVNAVVYLDGTAVTFSVKNNAGTSIYTNAVSLTGEATVLLQPGGAVITSGTGVAGRATPF